MTSNRHLVFSRYIKALQMRNAILNDELLEICVTFVRITSAPCMEDLPTSTINLSQM